MKHMRLWINSAGEPLYLEVLDGTFTEQKIVEIRAMLEGVRRKGKTVIVGPEIELRVLS